MAWVPLAIGAAGSIADIGMNMWSGYGEHAFNMLSKQVDLGFSAAAKGMSMLESGVSAYNKWKHERQKLEEEAKSMRLHNKLERLKFIRDNP
jgi:hypothetical protein